MNPLKEILEFRNISKLFDKDKISYYGIFLRSIIFTMSVYILNLSCNKINI